MTDSHIITMRNWFRQAVQLLELAFSTKIFKTISSGHFRNMFCISSFRPDSFKNRIRSYLHTIRLQFWCITLLTLLFHDVFPKTIKILKVVLPMSITAESALFFKHLKKSEDIFVKY